MKRILIINFFGIGDVLFTTPLIQNIKAADPHAFIGFLCNQRTAPILVNNSKINKIFIYERDDFQSVYKKSKIAFIKKIRSFLDEIKKEQFDCALDLSLNSYTSLAMRLIGIKNRIGFHSKRKRRITFLTHKIPLKGYENKHVVGHYLDLLKVVGFSANPQKMELPLSKEDDRWAQEVFRKNTFKDGEVIMGLVPGGGASWGKEARFKRWPAEKYAQLADKMVEKFSAKVILLGDSSERELCQEVASKMKQRSLNLCGETSITQMAAILGRCRLAVVNDGGPLHIAVAVGVKTISIFGPVDENVYGPYPKEGHAVVTGNIACRPCYRQFRIANCEHHNCLHLISVNDVLERVEENL